MKATTHQTTQRQNFLRTTSRALRNKKIVIGGGVFVLVLSFCILVPMLNPGQDRKQHLPLRLRGPSFAATEDAMRFLFGTDALGRDLVYRIAVGGRSSLSIGILAAAFAGLVGTAIGLVAGFAGGRTERTVMSAVDIQLALPEMLIALLLIATLGQGIINLLIAMVISGWAMYARMVRGRVLSLKNESYIEAAQAIGASRTRIIACHIFPQTLNMLIVLFTQQVGFYVMLEGSLSYLGLGVRIPTPSWGNIIADGRALITVAPWITTIPGVVLTITVSALFLLGDGFRDYFDPRLRRLKK